MSSNHSPGPWTVKEGRLFLNVIAASGFQVTRVPIVEEIDRANARMIAASPEMFALVEQMMRFMNEGADEIHFGALSDSDDTDTLTFGEAVRAAFKKVTGEK